MSIDRRTEKRMNRHLTWCIIQWRGVLTPFSTEYRCWKFNGGNYKFEFIECYIFGIRVARWRV